MFTSTLGRVAHWPSNRPSSGCLKTCTKNVTSIPAVAVPAPAIIREVPASAGAHKAAVFYAPTEDAMQYLAALLAEDLQPGDCYLLYGAVGAGKSTFSRAFIREVAQDDHLPVPSPTFLLLNTYDEHGEPPIHHFDLYRLSDPKQMERLDLQASFGKAVSLVEWPERLELEDIPTEHLKVSIEILQDRTAHYGLKLKSRTRSSLDEPLESSSQQASSPSLDPQSRSSTCVSSLDDDYSDQRWRQVTLVPHGHNWATRTQELVQHVLAVGSGDSGLILVADCLSQVIAQDATQTS